MEQTATLLPGICASHGVLPRLQSSHSVAGLLAQHLNALEQEAQEEGGTQQLLAEHFAKVYTVALPLAAA